MICYLLLIPFFQGNALQPLKSTLYLYIVTCYLIKYMYIRARLHTRARARARLPAVLYILEVTGNK